jgi:2-polyprenyl-3-methyl-5-hydroxy-6-metoxy-1,4-benzoquinol methylase
MTNESLDSSSGSKLKHSSSVHVQRFFTGAAMEYSQLFLAKRTGSNFNFCERLTLAVRMTSNISGRLLDCASGTGEITTAILRSERFTNATIIDLSPRMLEMAQQCTETQLKVSEMSKLEFIVSDIFEFDAQSRAGQYDLILCLGLIAHTGRIDQLLSKLKTLLSPSGCILLQSSLLDHVGNRIVRMFAEERYYHKHGYRIFYFRHQDIVQAAKKTGLAIVALRRFTFGFPFGDRFCARINYHMESTMRKWSHSHGAEALYVLQHSPCEQVLKK